MYAKLGVNVKNESSKDIEVKITNGIKEATKIKAGAQVFLSSKPELRALFWREIDKDGKPAGIEYRTKKTYLRPNFIIIKNNPKDKQGFIYDLIGLTAIKEDLTVDK